MWGVKRVAGTVLTLMGVVAGIGAFPGTSEALDATLKAYALGATTPSFTCVVSTAPVPSGNTVTLNINRTTACGGFTITPQAGATQAQVAALTQDTQNQLIVRFAVIKYNGALGPNATLEIDAKHTFVLPAGFSVVTGPRYYGFGYNATFARNGGLSLAVGDSISKTGFYAYFVGGGTLSQEDGIGGAVGAGTTLAYTITAGSSTVANTIPVPSLQALEGNGASRKCIDLVPQNNCDPTRERLRTNIKVTLKSLDTVTIPNGAHDIAGGDIPQGTLPPIPGNTLIQATLDMLSAPLYMQQNNQNSAVVTVNPDDSGFLTLILACTSTDATIGFACAAVDTNNLFFGPGASGFPNGAPAVSAAVKDVINPNGGAKDGIPDLIVKFRQPQTGIACGDTSATLKGVYTHPTFGDLPFDSIVGFATVSPNCP